MNSCKIFIIAVCLTIICGVIGIADAYDYRDNYMQGTPGINTDYYNHSQSYQPNHPSYNSDYYNQRPDTNSFGYRDNSGYNDAPHGNDIRDYNPYYDRYGNRK